MDRVTIIRAEEKKYHDFCYNHYALFQPGSWLHKPVQTIMELMQPYHEIESLRVLDLGAGIGRNSIPIAELLKNRNGKVVCVDLLESAIERLQQYSKQFGVDSVIEAKLSDIEQFPISREEYDVIIAVSALEHVSSESVLEHKLHEMTAGTKPNGFNCIIIGSNIRETDQATGQPMDPMFEVNLTTDEMLALLDRQYAGWSILKRLVKPLHYDIDRNGQQVSLTTDCITFAAKKVK